MKKFAFRICTKKKAFCAVLIMGLIFAMSSTVFASDDRPRQVLIPLCPHEASARVADSINTSMFSATEGNAGDAHILDEWIRLLTKSNQLYLLENQFSRAIESGTNLYFVTFPTIYDLYPDYSPYEDINMCVPDIYDISSHDMHLVRRYTRFTSVDALFDNGGFTWVAMMLNQSIPVTVRNIETTLTSTTHSTRRNTLPNRTLLPPHMGGPVHFAIGIDNPNWLTGVLSFLESTSTSNNASISISTPFPRPLSLDSEGI